MVRARKRERDMRSKLYWMADGGHEWLVVPLSLARKGPGISTFSYQGPGLAYLEGDCDADLFLAHYGIDPATVDAPSEHYYEDDAPCRSLPSYRGGVA